ncbi:MAG: Nif11-like leader peptide family natural product precursor [Holophagales bacterium]|nr:Nif11-like leader peptide family natural product precursor [Holophagales bacterium]
MGTRWTERGERFPEPRRRLLLAADRRWGAPARRRGPVSAPGTRRPGRRDGREASLREASLHCGPLARRRSWPEAPDRDLPPLSPPERDGSSARLERPAVRRGRGSRRRQGSGRGEAAHRRRPRTRCIPLPRPDGREGSPGNPLLSAEDLRRFRELVLADPGLASSLRGLGAAFRERVVSLARERGLSVTEDEVAAAERKARRAWIERGLDG